MELINDPSSMRDWSRSQRNRGLTVGFVPTMGALHEGHLSLIRTSRADNAATVVSIFVNPTQFNDARDFAAYPRTLEADIELCRNDGVDALYCPTVEAMYPEGATTSVDPGPIAGLLEGAHRPGHFAAVATVVTKLLNAVEPDVAYFGAKDFQQVAVVRRIVADLDIAARVVSHPTVRDPDGVALSSRNVRLSQAHRRAAPVLFRALSLGASSFRQGETSPAKVRHAIEEHLAGEPLCRPEYVALVDPATFDEWSGRGPVVALVAAWFGDVRLIDNLVLSD